MKRMLMLLAGVLLTAGSAVAQGTNWAKAVMYDPATGLFTDPTIMVSNVVQSGAVMTNHSGVVSLTNNYVARGDDPWGLVNPKRDSLLTVDQMDERYGNVFRYPLTNDTYINGKILHPVAVSNGVPVYVIPSTNQAEFVLVQIPEWSAGGVSVGAMFGRDANTLQLGSGSGPATADTITKMNWTPSVSSFGSWGASIYFKDSGFGLTNLWIHVTNNVTDTPMFYPGDILLITRRKNASQPLTLYMNGLLRTTASTNDPLRIADVTYTSVNGTFTNSGAITLSNNYVARGTNAWDAQNPVRGSILTVDQLDERYGSVWRLTYSATSQPANVAFIHPHTFSGGTAYYHLPPTNEQQNALIQIPAWANPNGVTPLEMLGTNQLVGGGNFGLADSITIYRELAPGDFGWSSPTYFKTIGVPINLINHWVTGSVVVDNTPMFYPGDICLIERNGSGSQPLALELRNLGFFDNNNTFTGETNTFSGFVTVSSNAVSGAQVVNYQTMTGMGYAVGAIPTNTSQLVNDSGFITNATGGGDVYLASNQLFVGENTFSSDQTIFGSVTDFVPDAGSVPLSWDSNYGWMIANVFGYKPWSENSGDRRTFNPAGGWVSWTGGGSFDLVLDAENHWVVQNFDAGTTGLPNPVGFTWTGKNFVVVGGNDGGTGNYSIKANRHIDTMENMYAEKMYSRSDAINGTEVVNYQTMTNYLAGFTSLTFGTAPVATNSTGTAGAMVYDAAQPNYLYIGVGTDTWKRVQLLDW